MSSTTETSQTKKSPRRGKQREPWPQHAERHGVSTRTLDRWVEARVIPPPDYIRGRKYGDPTIEPRRDLLKNQAVTPRRGRRLEQEQRPPPD
jgi:hypothetical protein